MHENVVTVLFKICHHVRVGDFLLEQCCAESLIMVVVRHLQYKQKTFEGEKQEK